MGNCALDRLAGYPGLGFLTHKKQVLYDFRVLGLFRLSFAVVWNKFGTLEGEDWLPNNPKLRLSNDLWT